jgi:hypothetical protein
MTRHRRVALAAVLLLGTAACTSKQEAKADPGADQATVNRLVLGTKDIPAGWVAATPDPKDPLIGPISGCLAPQGPAPSANRSSERFTNGLLRSVTAEATVWPSPALAHNSVLAVTSDSFDVCATDAVKSYLQHAGITFISSLRVNAPVPPRGDFSARYARTFVIQGLDGKRTEISLDLLRVRRGRIAITCVLLGLASPLTDTTGRDFMDLMLNRVSG